jgi:Eukaryotic aspartyl protease
MGLENDGTSFWKQMFKAKAIKSPSFSLCYSRPAAADREGTEAGAMTMGGTDDRLHKTDMVFAPLQKQATSFYVVRLRKMYLRDGSGGTSAKPENVNAKYRLLNVDEDSLNRGQVIVDSGTTDTYFNNAIKSEFKKAWKEHTGKDYTQNGLKLSAEDFKTMPSVVLQIAGDETRNGALQAASSSPVPGLAGAIDPDHPNDMILVVPPTHYFEYDSETKEYIARFYIDERGGSVLGGNSIMGHDMFFDMKNEIMGVSESDCDYTSLLESHYNVTLLKPLVDPKADKGDNATYDHLPNTVPVDKNGDLAGDGGDGGNEEGGGVVEEEFTGACSALSCQMGFLVGVIVMVAVVAMLIVRRSFSSSQIEYALPGEMELQDGVINGSDDHASNGKKGGYLDGPEYRNHETVGNSFESDESDEAMEVT